MIGKFFRGFLLSGFVCGITACTSVQPVNPHSGMTYDLTLMAIPHTEEAVQIAFDVGIKGYPVILVSYERVDGKVQIHAWDGGSWVPVSTDAYKAGTFFRAAPTRAVLVGSKGQDVPAELIPSSTWCQQIYRTDSDETVSLLNFVGSGLNFSYPHWQWFAKRYGYKVSEINPRYLGDKWYYHNLSDYYDRKVKGIDYDAEPEINDIPVMNFIPMEQDEMVSDIEEIELDKQVEVIENPLDVDEIPAAEEFLEDDASMMQ